MWHASVIASIISLVSQSVNTVVDFDKWDRFDHYARRVEYLFMGGSVAAEHFKGGFVPVLQTLSCRRSVEHSHMFPRLNDLHWIIGNDSAEAAYIPIFLSPALERFRLEVPWNLNDNEHFQ